MKEKASFFWRVIIEKSNRSCIFCSNLFNFRINYNDPGNGATALYNGNISETIWETANDNVERWYKYEYDALNRLTSALDNTSDQRYSLQSISYDKNGNIQSLNRKGHLVEIPTQASHFGTMDDLSYDYDSGNKLLKVTDSSNKTYGFKDGTNTGNDYIYDINGNLLSDTNKGITNIEYNHLDLPTEIKFDNNNNKKINYTYDAIGAKLRKVVNDNGSITTTDYAGNYIYEDNTLQFFKTPEGYATPNANSFKYIYNYIDHLGNVRLSYSDVDGNGTISQSEIVEESNHYPFGLKMRGFNSNVNPSGNSAAQKWDFLGQERQEELGLNWVTFRYRNTDPALGRFFGVDPVSEEYFSISTYQFAHNNPIWKVEIEGLEGEITTKGAVEVINHEPVKKVAREISKSYIDDAGRLVLEGAKKSPSTLTKILSVGAKILGVFATIVTPTTLGNGNLYDSNGRNRLTGENQIDEKFQVDDKQIKTEGESNSPITRLDETSKVFRVQGGDFPNASKQRFVLDDNGNLNIQGDDMLFVTFDDEARAVQSLQKRGGNSELIIFDINKGFADKIRGNAVPQRLGKLSPGSPQQVDSSITNNSFGIPKEYFKELLKNINQSSVRRIAQ